MERHELTQRVPGSETELVWRAIFPYDDDADFREFAAPPEIIDDDDPYDFVVNAAAMLDAQPIDWVAYAVSADYGNRLPGPSSHGVPHTLRDLLISGLVLTWMGTPVWPRIGWEAEVQDRYVSMRRNGVTHKLAEMLARKKGPGLKTDSEFLKGRRDGKDFARDPKMGMYYKQLAERAGVSVNGKVYQRSLASYPGDPKAWVDGRGDVERVCLERGYNCEGMVTVKQGPRPAPPKVVVAPDILARTAAELRRENPGMKPEDAVGRAFEIRSGQVNLGLAAEQRKQAVSEAKAGPCPWEE